MEALVRASPVADLDYGVFLQAGGAGARRRYSFTLPFNSATRAAVTGLYLESSAALMNSGAFFADPTGRGHPWCTPGTARARRCCGA